jgi:hypothetical protein
VSRSPALPRKLRVGPYTYTVTLDQACVDDELLGETDPDRHTIRLNPTLPPALLRSTLLHEAMHAVAVSGAAIKGDVRLNQEQWISRLESPLYALLVNNPALVRFLTT